MNIKDQDYRGHNVIVTCCTICFTFSNPIHFTTRQSIISRSETYLQSLLNIHIVMAISNRFIFLFNNTDVIILLSRV